MDNSKVNITDFKKFVGYLHLMTAYGVVTDLLAQDKELAATYWLAQQLNQSIANKNSKEFIRLISMKHENTSEQMKTVLETYVNQKDLYNQLTFFSVLHIVD